jgi:hypothetical protein
MALLTTSVVLAAGFIILSFSAFDLNAGMGKLTAITIVLALTADFFLLPPVLMKFEARKALLFDKPLPESSAQPVPLRVENYTQKSIS